MVTNFESIERTLKNILRYHTHATRNLLHVIESPNQEMWRKQMIANLLDAAGDSIWCALALRDNQEDVYFTVEQLLHNIHQFEEWRLTQIRNDQTDKKEAE